MIKQSEIDKAAKLFGAPNSQILRDHLLSHVTAGIADWPDQNRVTFFGGTALCRTWLPDLRLSEDIDLLLDELGDSIDIRDHVSRRLRRDFPNLEWTLLGTQHEVETWTLTTTELDLKVQFAQWHFGWQDTIPTVTTPVRLRYSDLANTAALKVPDPSGSQQ
jgi:predicted nucleotidyltransferase component of viral defense system